MTLFRSPKKMYPQKHVQINHSNCFSASPYSNPSIKIACMILLTPLPSASRKETHPRPRHPREISEITVLVGLCDVRLTYRLRDVRLPPPSRPQPPSSRSAPPPAAAISLRLHEAREEAQGLADVLGMVLSRFAVGRRSRSSGARSKPRPMRRW